MNKYNFIIGGSGMANTTDGEKQAWLDALTQAWLASSQVSITTRLYEDSTGDFVECLQIEITTRVRVTLPADVDAALEVVIARAAYLDDDYTNVITTEDKPYPVIGDLVWTIGTGTYSNQLDSLKVITIPGASLYIAMGNASVSNSNVFTPFSAADATAYYTPNAPRIVRNKSIGNSKDGGRYTQKTSSGQLM